MSNRFLIALSAALLGSASLHAAQNVLVASNRSNSIEEFNASGTWLRTFATTGPYAPVAMAQSPLTGEIFVTTTWGSGPYAGQLTNKILRYGANGSFDPNWDTFIIQCDTCPTTVTQSLLFDSAGDLWVATAYGTDLGGPIYIFKYLAADLTSPNPPAQPGPIAAPMFRGNQMAFNKAGNLCIAGFIDEDVKCFDTSTGLLTVDYYAEIHASNISPTIEPAGLAFDAKGRMYLTSVFGGQVAYEVAPGGPINLLAALTSAPNQLAGNLVMANGSATILFPIAPGACFTGCLPAGLYTTSILPNPTIPGFSVPDPVYEISKGPTVTKFISGSAPPALGSDHIWGAYWMIVITTHSFALLGP